MATHRKAKACLIALLAAGLLSSPIQAGLFGKKSSAEQPQAISGISYAPAQNKDLRVSVDRVIGHGHSEYMPKGKGWLQLHVLIANRGSKMLSFTDMRQRLPNGTVVQVATGAHEVAKAPSLVGTAAGDVALGSAGIAAGYLVAAPLSLAVQAFSGFKKLAGMDSEIRRSGKIGGAALKATSIAPGTSIEGVVFVPADREHSGLLAFYAIDQRQDVLSVNRVGQAAATPAFVPVPAGIVQAEPGVDSLASPPIPPKAKSKRVRKRR